MKISHLISGEEVVIFWEQKELIDGFGSGCSDWHIEGEGLNGKSYTAIGSYQGDDLQDVTEIEEV